jgi:DNA-directed RNA polymerase subunit RPC12/RpoP
MPFFHSHSHIDKLRCPYKGCEKTFDKPTLLTDSSNIIRKSHYACPHCMSKLEIKTDKMKIVSVNPAEYPKVFESPAKCAHFSSYATMRPKNMPLADECLLCPKVLQCEIRK